MDTQEILNHTVDRTGWPPGPWDGEPDRVDFEHAGFPCLILRVRDLGHLCGYVGVPPGHPLHGVEHGQEAPVLAPFLERRMDKPLGTAPGFMLMLGALCGEVKARPDTALDVHGGITWSKKCSGRICHVPKPGQPEDVFWFGFDCGHSGDYAPYMDKMGFRPASDSVYRTVGYVRREIERLAEQLRDVAETAAAMKGTTE